MNVWEHTLFISLVYNTKGLSSTYNDRMVVCFIYIISISANHHKCFEFEPLVECTQYHLILYSLSVTYWKSRVFLYLTWLLWYTYTITILLKVTLNTRRLVLVSKVLLVAGYLRFNFHQVGLLKLKNNQCLIISKKNKRQKIPINVFMLINLCC